MVPTYLGLGRWLQTAGERLQRDGMEGIRDISYDMYRAVWWPGMIVPSG